MKKFLLIVLIIVAAIITIDLTNAIIDATIPESLGFLFPF